jgi:hypothetical protein
MAKLKFGMPWKKYLAFGLKRSRGQPSYMHCTGATVLGGTNKAQTPMFIDLCPLQSIFQVIV